MISLCSYIALEVECTTEDVPGRQTFECQANNKLSAVICIYEDRPPERCSFPLVVTFDMFGTEKHTIDVLIVDVFRHLKRVSFKFQLAEPISIG